MHGELRVGRIWSSPGGNPEVGWLWTLNGIFSGPDADLRHSGLAATLVIAKAELETEWAKWLAWANLSEAFESAQATPARNRPTAS
jgi:hypothetical protein